MDSIFIIIPEIYQGAKLDRRIQDVGRQRKYKPLKNRKGNTKFIKELKEGDRRFSSIRALET